MVVVARAGMDPVKTGRPSIMNAAPTPRYAPAACASTTVAASGAATATDVVANVGPENFSGGGAFTPHGPCHVPRPAGKS